MYETSKKYGLLPQKKTNTRISYKLICDIESYQNFTTCMIWFDIALHTLPNEKLHRAFSDNNVTQQIESNKEI